jgi:hypothetical protein
MAPWKYYSGASVGNGLTSYHVQPKPGSYVKSLMGLSNTSNDQNPEPVLNESSEQLNKPNKKIHLDNSVYLDDSSDQNSSISNSSVPNSFVPNSSMPNRFWTEEITYYQSYAKAQQQHCCICHRDTHTWENCFDNHQTNPQVICCKICNGDHMTHQHKCVICKKTGIKHVAFDCPEKHTTSLSC